MEKGTKDLSKKENSATSVFMRILPRIKEINCMNMPESEKVELASKEIIDGLTQAKIKDAYAVSNEYIANYKDRLQSCLTVDDIIMKLRYSINKGRNYHQ